MAPTVTPLTFPVGQSAVATVTVTAGNAALTNVSLGSGLVIAGNFATVTKGPKTLSVNSLAAGASQNFNFTLKGTSSGGDLITVNVTANSANGAVSTSAESKYDVGTFATPPFSGEGTSGPLPRRVSHRLNSRHPGRDLSLPFGHNLENAGITVAVILFITFPANMFNNTFSSNYGEIVVDTRRLAAEDPPRRRTERRTRRQ